LVSVGQDHRGVELAARQHGLEDAERRRQGAQANGRAGLGQALAIANPKPPSSATATSALAAQIDVEASRVGSGAPATRIRRSSPTTPGTPRSRILAGEGLIPAAGDRRRQR
jgi:hypothetical protein